MPYPSLTFSNLLEQATRNELEQFVSLLQGYLSAQHDEDGAHTDITGTSVTLTGDVTSEGDGTFDGTVTADADGTPITLGPLGPTTEPALRLKNGTTSDWQLYAKGSRTLAIRDVLEVGDTSMLDIVRTGSSTYDVRPHSSAITLNLGTDASGQRCSSVNGAALTSSSSITANGLLHLKSRLAPTQIVANQNDYAINTALRVFISSDAARDITGIAAGADGQQLWLTNAGSFTVTLKIGSGSSVAANRFNAANGADVALRTGGTTMLQYDLTSGLWWIVGV